MRTKSKVFVLSLLITLSSFIVLAQTTSDEVELTRAVIQAQRQAILSQAMNFSEEESKKFWPLYRDYLVEVNKLVDREVKLITTYADNYRDLSEEMATWILDEFIALERAEADLKAGWVPRFREVLPPRKVARFFQLENKMDTIIEYDLATSIPLVE
jgi:hypothetical protein